MKMFLDDFIVYNDMENHLQKFKLCFQKCKEYGINLNIYKCAFMIFSRMMLDFIVSKKGKLPYLKKIQAIKHAITLKSPTYSSIQWDGIVLQMFYQKICFYYDTYH